MMCGIAGIFSSSGNVSAEALSEAARVLGHRGPDSQNQWIETNGKCGLAHARLSLNDLSSNANQPLSSARDNIKLVHNGEFYGFEQIRKELEGRGHHFRTRSDSEILLPLYQDFGVGALEHLRGEFAFVLWDRNNQSVFAARDRFGIKPLFYSFHGGRLFFASEVKALFAMGVPAQWDMESVFQFSNTWILSSHRTLYKDIFQIPPGHALLASANAGFRDLRLMPYWDFDYPTERGGPAKALDVNEEVLLLREKLQEAVSLRLRADVPVACYLSGGLDSCSILGAASKHASQPIHAFTLSFTDDPLYDESAIAREMARLSRSTYHEIPLKWDDLAANFEDAVWRAEMPLMNTHGVAKYLLSKAVRAAGFKAVLTGEGSDEIFAGYVHFRKDALLGHDASERSALLSRLSDANVVSRHFMLGSGGATLAPSIQSTLGFVPSFIEANAQGSMKALLKSEFTALYENRDCWRALLNDFDVSRQLSGRAPVHQSLYLWSRTLLPNYLLTVLGDRMEMAHSIEGRLPFLDHKLVEHVVKMPVDLKIRTDLTEKYILREAAKPFITDTVYKRQKHPFLAPPATASHKSALFSYYQDTLRSRDFKENLFYDSDKVVGLLDSVPALDRDRQCALDGVFTTMLSMSVLQKRLGLTS